jgi:lipopolysaccharide/colanic/teichoic acid biosynthesis glycosyltransferase
MKSKFCFDTILSSVSLLLLSPVFIIIYFIVRITSSGPVIFRQTRIGKYGKPFTIYKFRTMYINDGINTISIKGDNRVTAIGKILRKYKLDELPELWNILKGDMSFVGPRPDVPGYADKLIGDARRILNLKPGLTGLATLKYANEEELLACVDNPLDFNNDVIFPDKVKINLEYLDQWTLWLDIKIILKTAFRLNF